MDSIPPPTAISTSPTRMALSSSPAARMPDAHTLLIVSEGTSLGMPALIWAWREGICPWPACSTWPMTTCSTSSAATPARSSAALIAVAPSSVASSFARPPPSFPTGVRAEERITVFGMSGGAPGSLASADGAEWYRRYGPGPSMEVAATTARAEDSGADTIVVGLFEAGSLDGQAQALVESGEARGGHGKLAVTHVDGRRWLVVGLGPQADFDAERAREAAAAAIGRARELSARVLCWAASDAEAERIEGL